MRRIVAEVIVDTLRHGPPYPAQTAPDDSPWPRQRKRCSRRNSPHEAQGVCGTSLSASRSRWRGAGDARRHAHEFPAGARDRGRNQARRVRRTRQRRHVGGADRPRCGMAPLPAPRAAECARGLRLPAISARPVFADAAVAQVAAPDSPQSIRDKVLFEFFEWSMVEGVESSCAPAVLRICTATKTNGGDATGDAPLSDWRRLKSSAIADAEGRHHDARHRRLARVHLGGDVPEVSRAARRRARSPPAPFVRRTDSGEGAHGRPWSTVGRRAGRDLGEAVGLQHLRSSCITSTNRPTARS